MVIIFDFQDQYQSTNTQLISEILIEKLVIRLSSLKKLGIRLNVVCTIANAFIEFVIFFLVV